MIYLRVCMCGVGFQTESAREERCSACVKKEEELNKDAAKAAKKRPYRKKRTCPKCLKVHRDYTILCERCHAGWMHFEYEPKPEDFIKKEKKKPVRKKEPSPCKVCLKNLARTGYWGCCGLECLRLMRWKVDVVEVQNPNEPPNYKRYL